MSYTIELEVVDNTDERFICVEDTCYANAGTWTHSRTHHTLFMENSGTSGMLRFKSSVKETICLAVGVHNYKRWCDIIVNLEEDATANKIHPTYYEGSRHNKLWDQSPKSNAITERGTILKLDFSVKKGNQLSAKFTIDGPPKKILSIDAGGTHGLSSLLILQRIMHRLGVEPYQYFDLIGGTGTGGIIALMLGRLRMSIHECINAYYDLTTSVFGNPQPSGNKEIFRAKDLEDAIKSVIEKKLGKDEINAPLLDPVGDQSCKTVVFTIAKDHPNAAEPTNLRTYENRFSPSGDCTIWQAAMATSATPPFFPPIALALSSPIPVKYIDAGMGFNNPSSAVFTEAWRIWGSTGSEMDFKQKIGCFLSLGTGFLKVARLDDESFQTWISKQQIPLAAAEVLRKIATDSERIHSMMGRRFDGESQVYYRFNVEQGLQETQLFEYEKLGQVVVDTNAYLDKNENEVKITCLERMPKLHVEEEMPDLSELH